MILLDNPNTAKDWSLRATFFGMQAKGKLTALALAAAYSP